MKLIIDIPEDVYNDMIKLVKVDGDIDRLVDVAIANGMPLPQGHGKSSDTNLAKRMIGYGWSHPDCTVYEFIEDFLPTIIKAESEDKENEEC